jgi:hypothetical protein
LDLIEIRGKRGMTAQPEGTDIYASLYVCASLITILVALGFSGSGLLEWRKARHEHATRQAIHYAEAWTRVVVGLCIAAASVVVIMNTRPGDTSAVHLSTSLAELALSSEVLVSILFFCAVAIGLVSFSLTVLRHVVMLRDLHREGLRQDL